MDDKELGKFMEKSAKKSGQVYFDSVKHQIKNLLDEVKSNESKWKLAMANKSYAGSDTPIDHRVKIDAICWNMNAMKQFNTKCELAGRAIAQITLAYDVEM